MFERSNKVMVVVRPRKPIDDSIRWFNREYSGSGFDWMVSGAMGMRNRFPRLWGILASWFNWDDAKRFNCVEVLTKILSHAGYRSVSDVNENIIDTMQLCRIMLDPLNNDEYEAIEVHPSMKKFLVR